MMRPNQRLTLCLSVGLGLLTAWLGFKLIDPLPERDLRRSPLISSLQRTLKDRTSVGESFPERASPEDLERWKNFSGGLKNDVLYYIFIDRFFDGDKLNNQPNINPSVPASLRRQELEQKLSNFSYDPDRRLFGLYFGGDLDGVRAKLPYLANLGITKIVLSPIQEGVPGFRVTQSEDYYLDNGDGSRDATARQNLLTNYHGYWIRDWYRLDPHLRSSADPDPDSVRSLKTLLDEAAKYGIGVILDLTLHHSSPVANRSRLASDQSVTNVFPSRGEVRRRGQILADPEIRPDWYTKVCQMDYGRATVSMLTSCQIDIGLPTLNLKNPAVEAYLLDAVNFWFRVNQNTNPIAGMRIDAIKHLRPQFVRQLVRKARMIRPNAIIFAEDFGGGSQASSSYDVFENAGDISTIDFSFTSSIRYFFSGDRSWSGNPMNLEASSLGAIQIDPRTWMFPSWFANPASVLPSATQGESLFPINYQPSKSWITSIETHDAPRLRTFRPRMSNQQYGAMIAFHLLARGVPMFNYGAEIGLSVPPLPRNSGLNGLGGDPFNRQMMVWPGQPGFNAELYSMSQRYVKLRRSYPVLRTGDTFFLRPVPDLFWKRPILMLRSHRSSPSSLDSRIGFLYAYSPEGGTFQFRLPDSHGHVASICALDAEVRPQRGSPGRVSPGCLRQGAGDLFQLELKPEHHRVFKVRFS